MKRKHGEEFQSLDESSLLIATQEDTFPSASSEQHEPESQTISMMATQEFNSQQFHHHQGTLNEEEKASLALVTQEERESTQVVELPSSHSEEGLATKSSSSATATSTKASTQSMKKKRKLDNKKTQTVQNSNSFGNYKNYYSYRYNNENIAKPKGEDKCLIDPRLEIISNCLVKYFRESTLEMPLELTCMDIGCNQGLFSMQLADFYESQLGISSQKEINLKSMNNIDIDAVLIRKAKDHLTSLKKFNTNDEKEDDKYGMSVNTYVSIQRAENNEDKEGKIFIWKNNRKLLKVKGDETLEQVIHICKKSYINSLIDKVHFRVLNFVEEITEEKTSNITNEKMMEILSKSTTSSADTYDIISCLSVTKWIHLNYGDHAVKFLFHKIFKLLKSGGVFIHEPQHWKSYSKKRELTPNIQENFKTIKFRPTSFHEYLLKEVGFSSSETFFVDINEEKTAPSEKTDKQNKTKKGFKKRPIVFYYK